MAGCRQFLKLLLAHRNYLIVYLTPLILLPLPIIVSDLKGRCGYMLLLMGVYWCTEALPLAVTGLIPVFLAPMFGILTTQEVCFNYLKDNTMMFTGGLIVAIGVEYSNLHRRIAIRVLMTVGTTPQWLMLGFMLPTWFLSMWISNTATTAMMLPIMEAVLDQLKETHGSEDGKTEGKKEEAVNGIENRGLELDEIQVKNTVDDNESDLHITKLQLIEAGSNRLKNGVHVKDSRKRKYTVTADVKEDNGELADTKSISSRTSSSSSEEDEDKGSAYYQHMCKGMTIAVAYAANVGGTATLTGTGPNTIMKGHADDLWIEQGFDESPVTYTSWLIYGFPVAVINFIFVYIWLVIFYIGFKAFKCQKEDEVKREAVRSVIRREHDNLGPITFHEVAVGMMFVVLVLLWFFRAPGFMKGWADLFEPGFIGDAVPAILIACFLFAVPKNIPSISKNYKGKKAPALLNWPTVHTKYPWSIIFLMGGGFALAEACEVSGLSAWIGDQLTVFGSLPGWAMVAIICLLVAMLTEVTSNSATCTILMPIVAAMAEGLGKNPLYLMFPTAIATSFAFMLPVATPPNAIAFSYGRISVIDMVKAGSLLNVLCVIGVTLANHTWAMAYFNLDVLPWAINDTVTTTTAAP